MLDLAAAFASVVQVVPYGPKDAVLAQVGVPGVPVLADAAVAQDSLQRALPVQSLAGYAHSGFEDGKRDRLHGGLWTTRSRSSGTTRAALDAIAQQCAGPS